MKKILLLWLFLACGFLSFSQNITVIDIETNEPIRDAIVSCQTLDTKPITDVNGQANLYNFENVGEILVTASGYKSLKISYVNRPLS